MASSTEPQYNNPLTPYAYAAATAAPPPTPSTHNLSSDNGAATSEALSSLLHRLPITLSAPPRRSSNAPLISLSDQNLQTTLISAATGLGFFHLAHRPIAAAESAAGSLFDLSSDRKKLLFPNNWPVGYNDDDDHGEVFCLDSSCFTRNDFELDSLPEFMGDMVSVGLRVIQELAAAAGFEKPGRDKLYSLLWISDDGLNESGRVYPYVVGLHYQMKCKKCSLWSDSGWVNVSGLEDSVLVTLGDIAQVWSNGKFKKVRGRPVPCLGDDDKNDSRCITMSLLITLPLETTVSPLISNLTINEAKDQENEEKERSIGTNTEQRMFHSFPFEDYAWKVYHERLLLKDPLIRYRV